MSNKFDYLIKLTVMIKSVQLFVELIFGLLLQARKFIYFIDAGRYAGSFIFINHKLTFQTYTMTVHYHTKVGFSVIGLDFF